MSMIAGQSPAAATFGITNTGSGVISGLSVGTISYGPGASGWLTASLSGLSVTLRAPNASSLALGTYYATVPVQSTDPDVVNNPRSVTVVLTVIPTPPKLIVTPEGFAFTFKAGTTPHLSGGFVVSSSVSTPFTDVQITPNPAGPFYGAPTGWFALNLSFYWACPSLSAPSPTGSRVTPCELQFSANPPASLTPGDYSFSFDVKSPAESAGTAVAVQVTVTP
jgi:hypothetical protein